MREKLPVIVDVEVEVESPNVATYREIGQRFYEQAEGLPFPGFTEAAYARLKAESDEFPDLMTPIDDLIVRFKEVGMQVFVEENGNVFILPYDLPPTADNVRDYSVMTKSLIVTPDMNADLKKLILFYAPLYVVK